MSDIKMDIKVEGFDHLLKAFADLGKDAMPYLRDAANIGAEKVAKAAREKAPVLQTKSKTRVVGHLKESITVKKAKVSSAKGITTATINIDEPYGVPVELGHQVVTKSGKIVGHAKARPFLRPAFDENKEEVFYGMVDAMNEALEKMGGIK